MSGARGGVLLLAGMVLFFWGCGSPYYFDLQSEFPGRQGNVMLDKVLLVEDVEINETYRDFRIVSRESPFQVRYHRSASWSKPPDELIEDMVALFWKQRMIFKKVNTYGSGEDPDWTMKIRIGAIERFRVLKKWYARLALELEIMDAKNNEPLLTHSFDRKLAMGRNRLRLLPERIAQILQEELLKVEEKIRMMPGAKEENSGVASE